ncbi:MAG: hypothetical protein LBL04_01740 [Bacteroidales bacterium]|nr:hypothetical protein [Bacteroidales bacterium]
MKKNKYLIFCGFILLALAFNFKMNIAGSASFFNNFQYDGESLVVGRLILSERNNIFDHARFLGWVQPTPAGLDPYLYQYEAYQHAYDFESYQAYYSHPAYQSLAYGVICAVTGMNGYPALDFLKWLVSIFTALLFTLFIAWVQRRWGWATAFFVFFTVCFSQWVTAFGRNLFWILGAFYVPFVFALWYLQKYEPNDRRSIRTTFWLMFFTMLFKCLFTGFEYITTALVMSVTPWFFYAIMNRWGWKKFLQSVSVASAGALAAVVAGIACLTVQLSSVSGSISRGFKYILTSFGRRSHGNAGEFDSFFRESLDSNLWDVLRAYWNGHAIDLSHWFDHPLWQSVGKVSFGFCVLLFLLITWVVFQSKIIRKHPVFRRQQVALAMMLWISLLAPLSWFVIFKAHSYVHTHMNHIVWHMPFILLGAAFMGSTLWFFIRNIFAKGGE